METTGKTLRAGKLELSPWQERKVLKHLGEHFRRSIRTSELADRVIRVRLDRAKVLMRQTRASPCEIALDSGFCGQAHMSRTFHAFVGDTPRRWRRENMSAR